MGAVQDHDDEILVEDLLARMRGNPAAFTGVDAVARTAGRDGASLEAMFREHAHATPQWRLREARIACARGWLAGTSKTIPEIAAGAGFASTRDFEQVFRARNGMAPQAYRGLAATESFEIALPADFPAARVLRYLTRDPDSLTVRAVGPRGFREGVRLQGARAVVGVELGNGRARCEVRAAGAVDSRAAVYAHGWLLRRLGLGADVEGFQRRVAGIPSLAPLLRVEPGLRIPQTGTPFEALIWAIVGQQVNLAFAYRLLNRVVARAGVAISEDLYAPPLPKAVAALRPEDLRLVQFSRSKAEYLVGAARSVASGAPNLQELAEGSAVRAERELTAVRGIGKWTARYVMMRGLGFSDCVPVGDAGLVRGLKELYDLKERPGPQETGALMETFRPYRSLATFHLWQTLEEAE